MAIEQDQPQSAFPQELPPRPSQDNRSWKNRNCPNMRTCWHFSLRSYDPRNTPNKRTLFRKISMILILALRTALSVLSLISAIRAMNIAKIVIYAILSVLGFWFVAWCLAEIGEATGERQVLGRMISRNQLDGFLYSCAIIHTAIIILWWFALGGLGEGLVWLAMGLLIFIVTWICTWPPEYPPSNV